jgi:lambda family phage portal protein
LNLVDRAISTIAPRAAVNRQVARLRLAALEKFQNSGYSDGGASTTKKSLKGWRSWSASPEEDIDLSLFTLRMRCMDLYMNSPLGRSAIQTVRTNVIGSGLRLKSRIDSEFLGLTEEEADAWEKHTEREFALWADSVHCDALKLNNFYEQQQLAQLAWLQKGDCFVLLKQDKSTPFMPCGLRLHILEADRICTPNTLNNIISNGIFTVEGTAANGNRVITGVEIDQVNGAVTAYYVVNRYPQSFYIYNNLQPLKWDRVEAFGKLTGRPNVLHLMESERPEQRRGVPYLAPVIEAVKQLTRYADAEVMAAVVAGMFTGFVTTENPTTETGLGDIVGVDKKVDPDSTVSYELGNGAMNVMRPGEKVDFANPGRPNTAFEGFMNAYTRFIGAALEIPQELLQKAFNSSYSAARAALLEAWKMFKMRRTWMANDFCQPTYEEWLAQEVSMGRIKAPRFFDDPVYRKAWSGAIWNGPAAGQVNPTVEAQAAQTRVENGFSTREQEAMEINGSDFDKNIQQAARESKLMQEAGLNANQPSQAPVK